MPSGVAIYCLTDPRDGTVPPPEGRHAYIGYSHDPVYRLRQHLKPCNLKRRSLLTTWLTSLLRASVSPQLTLLFVASSPQEAKRSEIATIARWREQGIALVNGTSGGDGLINPPLAVRARIRDKLTGRKTWPHGRPAFSAEWRRKIALARAQQIMRSPSDDTRIRIRRAQIGRSFTDEHRARLRAAWLRRKARAWRERTTQCRLAL